MKIFKYLVALVAGAMAFTACEKDPADLYAAEATAPVMDAHADILLTENSTAESVTFSWKAARNLGDQILYTLYATLDEQHVTLGTTEATYITAGKEALREKLLTGFNVDANNNFSIGMYVAADNGVTIVKSEPITMNVFVYGDYVPAVVSVAESAHRGIVLSESMTENVEMINWTEARFEYGTNPLYKVEISYNDGDRQVLASGLTTTSYAAAPSTLNSMLIALGCPKDKASDVKLIVTSYLEGEGAPQLESTAVTVTVTTYTPSYPESLSLVGDFGGLNWGDTAATSPILKGDPNTGVYHGLVSYYGATWGMKIYYLHPKTEEAQWVGGQTEDGVNYTIGAAIGDNITPEEGSYVVYVDLSKGTMTLGKIESIGLIGSATAGGWDAQQNFTYNPETGAMEIKAIELGEGAYKVRVNDNWGDPWNDPTAYNLGGDPNNMTFGGSDIASEPGIYDVTMNLSNNTNYALNFTKTGDVVIEDPMAKNYGLVGTINNWGETADLVFEAVEGKDYKVVKNVTLTAEDQIKVRVDSDWAENYGAQGDDEPAVIAVDTKVTLVAGGKNMSMAAGSYDIYFYPKTKELIAVVAGAELPSSSYGLVGTINSWGGTPDMEFVAVEGSAYVAVKNVTVTADDQFKVRFANDWAENYGAAGDVEPYALTVGATETLVANGKNLSIAAGTYDFYFNAETKEFMALTAGEELPAPAVNYGLVGVLNSWGGSPDIAFTAKANGEYVLLGQALNANEGFKIRANNEWNDKENYGTLNGGVVAIDSEITLMCGGGSKDMMVETTGTYDLYFYPADLKLYVMTPGKTPNDAGEPVVPPTPTETVYSVAGDFNGWSDTDMTDNGDGYYVLKGQAVVAGNGFKFKKDHSWADANCWGSDGAATTVGVAITLTQPGANIPVPAEGTYDIYFNPTTGVAYVMNVGEVPGTPAPAAHTYSLAGTINGWSATDTTYTMTAAGSDVYTLSNIAMEAYAEFKICEDYAWTVSYGAAATVVLDQKFALTSNNGANIVMPATGTFNLTFYAATSELLIESVGTVTPPAPASEQIEVGLIGVGGEWNNDIKFTQQADGHFTVENVTLAATDTFKVRKAGAWDDAFNWGLASKGVVELGVEVELTCSGGSADMSVAADGKYNISFYPTLDGTAVVKNSPAKIKIEKVEEQPVTPPAPATPLEWGDDIFKNFFETVSGSDKNTEVKEDLDFGNGLKFIAGEGKCKFGSDGGKYRIQYGGSGSFDKQTLALTVSGPGTLELTIRSSNKSEERYLGVWVDQNANYTDPGYLAPVSGEDAKVHAIDCSSAKAGSVINFHCLGSGINVYNIKWTPAQ